MKTNVPVAMPKITTHEGANAPRITDKQMLRRSVMSCFLWENEFYENGVNIASRIMEYADKVSTKDLIEITLEARHVHNLRHVPLLLLTALVKRGGDGKGSIAQVVCDTIGRADEMAELLALYWKDGKKPLPKQMQKGLAKAFCKFNEYALAKYNRDGAIKLRDVMFLCHPKPTDEAQAALFKRVADNTLVTPDTWEVALSGGADKKETFTRLIQEGKLGYLALLRNLRNMQQAGVDTALVNQAILARQGGADKVLPFRFTAAARICPQFEPALDKALLANLTTMPPLDGQTIVLVDVSGSMDVKLSGKSDLSRADAAATLASIINGNLRVYSFSTDTVEVPPRKGMAGVDAILRSQTHSSTDLRRALEVVSKIPHDRLIVITDEQVNSTITKPIAEKAYMINVASARNGVGYGKGWIHIDGFSENVIKYIQEMEFVQ
jgi:60 kDa SS-A/Ro ribonucleoprotein